MSEQHKPIPANAPHIPEFPYKCSGSGCRGRNIHAGPFRKCSACRASRRRFFQSEKGQAVKRKFFQSEKGRAVKRKYDQSEKGRAVKRKYKRKYDQSEKGRIARRREKAVLSVKARARYLPGPQSLSVLQIAERIIGVGDHTAATFFR